MHMLGSEVRPGEAARYLSARSSNHQVKKTHQSKAGRSICLVQLQGQADSHRPKRGPDLVPPIRSDGNETMWFRLARRSRLVELLGRKSAQEYVVVPRARSSASNRQPVGSVCVASGRGGLAVLWPSKFDRSGSLCVRVRFQSGRSKVKDDQFCVLRQQFCVLPLEDTSLRTCHPLGDPM